MKQHRFLLMILLILPVVHCFGWKEAHPRQPVAVFQSARVLPVEESVDVVIVGGTVAAVSAAVSASRQGAKVFLVAPRPYLGEDMNATLRLSID
jgi:NADPH-dependent 2,4-dienoyl-CoA reductase/sulfur reductase-like enzyme